MPAALSPHLKFGTLSCRTFYWGLQDVLAGYKTHSQPPVSLVGQLLWREFFYVQSVFTPNFDRMVGNPVCKQVAWDYTPEWIDAWEHGRTGYPWIDAIMNQLRAEGWMHHLARHAVACFLTRGDLYQSWEHGAKVFDKYLLDSDWALNNGASCALSAACASVAVSAASCPHGTCRSCPHPLHPAGNWMWLSASAYFHQFFRVYSPVAFAKVSLAMMCRCLLARQRLAAHRHSASLLACAPPPRCRSTRRRQRTSASGCPPSPSCPTSTSLSRGPRRMPCCA